jgi:hypothetical protein
MQIREEVRKRKAFFRELEKITTQDNRAHFGLNKLEKNTNFDNFESHPETSVLLYHLNSGHGKFRDILALLLYEGDLSEMEKDPAYQQLLDEISDEALTDEEADKILDAFLRSHGKYISWGDTPKANPTLVGIPESVGAPHLCCGMCGIKTVQGRYNKFCETVALKDLPDEITLRGEALNRYMSLKQNPPPPTSSYK